MALQSLRDRVAIVTGASSGLGRATAVALARDAVRLVLVGRDAARLEQTAGLAREAGAADVLSLPLDVRSEPDMQRMAAATLEQFGAIDILVHSAGVLRAAGAGLNTVAAMTLREWNEVLDINLRGTFLANRAVLPAMLAARRGDILNLASRSGRIGLGYDGPYCASKFGVVGLSEALADEARSAGVRVQCLLPGKFETEVLAQIGLPQLGDIPPAGRVAETIRWLLRLPEDARLLSPLIEPLDQSGPAGWMAGAFNPRSRKESPMPSPFMSAAEDLRGKVVIITGGTGGIGLATARAVAQLGGGVVVADLDPARVAEVAAEVAAAGAEAGSPGALGVAMDVRQEADHARMVQATLERFGRIDALICCAGILRKRGTGPKLMVDVDVEEWDQVIDINLKGTFLANRAVLPSLVAQRSGLIVNISSIQGLQGRAYDGPYCASKFGVIGLSQAVADEVKSFGVKVQALMPAAIATPMWQQNLPAPMPGDALPPERVADLIVFMLLQPEDTVIVGPVIAPLGARRRKAAAKPAGD
jgi:3-oxoacyl-[acyl-carrier protein] reductase